MTAAAASIGRDKTTGRDDVGRDSVGANVITQTVKADEIQAELLKAVLDLAKTVSAQGSEITAMREDMSEVKGDMRTVKKLLQGNGEQGLIALAKDNAKRITALEKRKRGFS